MSRLTENKIILVTRKTRLDDIIVKFNTFEQAKFYIEHLGSDFEDYQNEDQIYKKVISEIESELRALGRVHVVERSYLPNFVFGKNDIVVVVGQDGLVANTLKYLDGHPVIAINPEPERFDGVLLPFYPKDAGKIVTDVFSDRRDKKQISFAKVELQNGQYLYGVNDIFIGPKSHTSARYELDVGGQSEIQSSSGIIISTGLGSTGWLSSVVAGARGVIGVPQGGNCSFGWSDNYLQYSVREPFPSNITGVDLVFGRIGDKKPMVVTSLMASHGVIFSDGIESDFLEFNSGTSAKVGVAKKKGQLVI